MTTATAVPALTRQLEQDVRAVAKPLDRAESFQGGRRSGPFAAEKRAFVDDRVRCATLAQGLQRQLRVAWQLADRKRQTSVVRWKEAAVAVQQRTPVHDRVIHRAQVEVGIAEREL